MSRDPAVGNVDLSSAIGHSFSSGMTGLAQTCARAVYGSYFQLIPIERWVTNAALLPAQPGVTYYGGDIIARKDFVCPLQDELYLAMLQAQIFGVRLAIPMGTAPLFLLVCVLGLVDGLAQRHIRRGGNPPLCTTAPSSSSSPAWPWGRWSTSCGR